ncbi:nuclear transport factor 2 family protein [Fulvivirgaceae bacterium BMA10]|uniref:Nuclear transport factor 2 family protein n=1 Tax=Splendidivirga corallicola TaxID=3051826 RepID=A0ABT8KL88_9BACT|nr:nuclear transport factor 2 family protein [Fulvivirgaceae bacterium BMA10]
MRIFIIISCYFLVFTVGAQSKKQDKDKQAIKAAVIDMWDAIEKRDLDKYAKHIHPDYTYFGESDIYLNEGKAFDVNNVRGFIQRATNFHTEMHQPQITIKGDVAWIVYYWTDGGKINGEQFSSKGKSTRIFVKENGTWLCIHSHFTEVK